MLSSFWRRPQIGLQKPEPFSSQLVANAPFALSYLHGRSYTVHSNHARNHGKR